MTEGAYAPQFFTERHHTPWGAAINFDGEDSRPVRDFFIHNALYWMEEYHFDGLRLDAVHAIMDDSERTSSPSWRKRVHDGPGARSRRYIWCSRTATTARAISAARAQRDLSEAQWNDDVHHCLHVILTGETDGYYEDYARESARDAVPLSRGRLRLPGRELAHEGGARAASRARTCRPRRSSTSCRTTTRSAIARSASGSDTREERGGARAQRRRSLLLAPSTAHAVHG